MCPCFPEPGWWTVARAAGTSPPLTDPGALPASTQGRCERPSLLERGPLRRDSGLGVRHGQRDHDERGRQDQRRAAECGRGDRAAEQPGER